MNLVNSSIISTIITTWTTTAAASSIALSPLIFIGPMVLTVGGASGRGAAEAGGTRNSQTGHGYRPIAPSHPTAAPVAGLLRGGCRWVASRGQAAGVPYVTLREDEKIKKPPI